MLQFSKTNIRLERKMQLMEKEVFVSSQHNLIFFLFSEKGGSLNYRCQLRVLVNYSK
jgi:hypothetical protein